ncbi:ATPase [Candidatus Termititenax aidoneus]|uniref:ATPase n=1 Tax=Termititenax aidoneus TaxID=2218524 RepID=A0A388TBS6_TERA1|nr:ATPase [Candidatus Termititenax aidoneus]
MKEYRRAIENIIKSSLFEKGMLTIIYGPRQVGKTTLAKRILKEYKSEKGYFNCELQSVADIFAAGNPESMRDEFGGHKVIVFDEAQTIPDIGRKLKLFIDTYPKTAIIATGSSSFELANKINEPLTGRHYEYFLSPLSTEEMLNEQTKIAVKDDLNTRLIYGNYPAVYNAKNNSVARQKLELLATSYLYRDVLRFGAVLKSEVLMNILKALAHQAGGEVSYNEIAGLVGIDRKTVLNYIGLLEQAFIIFRLTPYTNRKRDEIKKLRKVYFYDNGILNALTNNFTSVGSGRDLGGLWENYMVSERVKFQKNHLLYRQNYYWRKRSGAEVDFIEEYDGKLVPFEFKYNKSGVSKGAAIFTEEYAAQSAAAVRVINKDNFLGFVS